jgi:hypothetical protein
MAKCSTARRRRNCNSVRAFSLRERFHNKAFLGRRDGPDLMQILTIFGVMPEGRGTTGIRSPDIEETSQNWA